MLNRIAGIMMILVLCLLVGQTVRSQSAMAAPTTEPSAAVPSAATPSTATPSTQPINKMCAVEGEDPIDPAVTVVYKGQTIGFCCGSCVKKFNADPEKYMKTLK